MIKPESCSLFNSIGLLFMSSERVKEFNADTSILELAEGTPALPILKEFFDFAKKQKSMKKPIMGSANFPITFEKKEDIGNVEHFFGNLMLALKSIIIGEKMKDMTIEGPVPKMSDLLQLMLTEGYSALEDAAPESYLVFLAKLLYQSFEELYPQPPANPDDPTEERSLGDMLGILQDESNTELFKKALDEKPLDSTLAQELIRNLFGDEDTNFIMDSFSPKILDMFARILDAELKKISPEQLVSSKMVTAEIPDRYSLSVFHLSSSLSFGISKFPQKFLMERSTLSSEFFIPDSTYFEMQKTKIIRSLKLENAGIPEEIPEDQVTPFDKPVFPVLRDMICKLTGGVQYVTEDFDWKFVVYDFKCENFITLFFGELTCNMPHYTVDYGFFFGSRHLGWASTQTMNILIVTDKRLRYLTLFQKNITLFVAPNENTPLEYLVEYIRQSINIDFNPRDPSVDHTEIIKHCHFMAKYSDTIKHQEFDLTTKLVDLRNAINPDFNKDSKQVDFVCYFKHPQKPKFVNYRTKNRKVGTMGTHPTKMKVDSIKPDPSKTIAHIQRWALGPHIVKIDGKPLVVGKPIPFYLPVFMLLDVRGGAQTLIDTKSSITFSYLEWLSQGINYGLTYKYRLRGLICLKEDNTYYPVAVKTNLTDGKTFESGNPLDVKLENVVDTTVHFIYLEREIPTA